MVNKSEIYANKGELELLFGLTSDESKKMMINSHTNEVRKTIPLSDVIIISKTRSYDPRYDALDIVDKTLESLSKGLPVSIKQPLLTDAQNIRKKDLVGKYKVLKSIVSESEYNLIKRSLEESYEYKVNNDFKFKK